MMSRNQKLALVCARRALDDAGYQRREFDRARTGVIMAAAPGELAEITDEIVQTRRVHARLAGLAQTPEQKRLLDDLWRAYAAAIRKLP